MLTEVTSRPAGTGAKVHHAGDLGLVVTLIGVACLLAAAALLAFAAPAQAFPQWAHGGLPETECSSCHLSAGGATDDACTFCHGGFKPTDGKDCWDCHEPGADTSGLSSPSSACSQECHLYSDFDKAYLTPYTHGALPHDGASGYGPTCLDCHSTSVSITDPGTSPHHDGVAQQAPTCVDCHPSQKSHDGAACEDCHDGMNLPPRPATCTTCHDAAVFGGADCASCHAGQIHNPAPDVGTCQSCHKGYQKHAGELNCTACHTNAKSFHHKTQAPKVKSCRSCHAKKHDGKSVSGSKCASCHKGSAPSSKPRAQHSSKITKKYTCSLCHSKGLHAKAYGASMTCRTCHKSRFHAVQAIPGSSICINCHGSARYHANGYRCTTCHRGAVHDTTPHA